MQQDSLIKWVIEGVEEDLAIVDDVTVYRVLFTLGEKNRGTLVGMGKFGVDVGMLDAIY